MGKSLVGRKFSGLSVIERTQKRHESSGKPLYLCRCRCGKEKLLQAASIYKTKSCGCLNAKPMGHTFTKQSGYNMVKVRMKTNGSGCYKYEHVHVMEQHLGRELFPEETVHHKNGVRNDNRISNLELWASNHPRGQKIKDLVSHAIEVLTRYSPESLA
jgi:hypothetical protein